MNLSEKIHTNQNINFNDKFNFGVCNRNNYSIPLDSNVVNLIINKNNILQIGEPNLSDLEDFQIDKRNYLIGIVSFTKSENKELYIIKFQSKDTINSAWKYKRFHCNYVLLVVQNKIIKSFLHISHCDKDKWSGSHVDFSIKNDKISLKLILDYTDVISDDDPENGVFKEEFYSILENGSIKFDSKWVHPSYRFK